MIKKNFIIYIRIPFITKEAKMVKKIDAIDLEKELTIEEKIALGLIPAPTQQIQQQNTLINPTSEMPLEGIEGRGLVPATGEYAAGSLYQGIEINKTDSTLDNNTLKKIKNEEDAEIVKSKIIEAKTEIPKIDGELAQKSSLGAQDGTPVTLAKTQIDAHQQKIDENNRIAQQYTTQAETLTAQYSNTSRVHTPMNDSQLSNGTKNSTAKTPSNIDLTTSQEEKLIEEEKKKKFKDYEII